MTIKISFIYFKKKYLHIIFQLHYINELFDILHDVGNCTNKLILVISGYSLGVGNLELSGFNLLKERMYSKLIES